MEYLFDFEEHRLPDDAMRGAKERRRAIKNGLTNPVFDLRHLKINGLYAPMILAISEADGNARTGRLLAAECLRMVARVEMPLQDGRTEAMQPGLINLLDRTKWGLYLFPNDDQARQWGPWLHKEERVVGESVDQYYFVSDCPWLDANPRYNH